jgi:hypothetical protein
MLLRVVGKKVYDVSIDRNAFTLRVKQFKKSPRKSHLSLMMKAFRSFETAGTFYPVKQCNIQEELKLKVLDLLMILYPTVGEGLRFPGRCLSV